MRTRYENCYKYALEHAESAFWHGLLRGDSCLHSDTGPRKLRQFGMPKNQMAVGIDYFIFSRWMLMMSAPILINGYFLEQGSKVELFSVLRIKKRISYRLYLLLACCVFSFVWTCGITVGAAGIADLFTAVRLFCVLLPNLILWTCVQYAAYVFLKGAAWSGILTLALIGASCLLGEFMPRFYPFLPSSWGMLHRSAVYVSGGLGITAMAIRSLVFIAVCLVAIIDNPKEEI